MRSKLAAVLLVPAIAFLVLASINMAAQISSARDFGRGATVAEFGRQASTVVHELQAERDMAAGYVAAGRPASNQPKIDSRSRTPRRATAYNAKLPSDADPRPTRPFRVPDAPNERPAGGPAAQRGQRAGGVPGRGRGARRRRLRGAGPGRRGPRVSSTA